MSMRTALPLVDLSSLKDPSLRSQTIDSVQIACKEIGFFQVINHGISHSVKEDAIGTATEFFNLSKEEKMLLASDDLYKAVRYSSSTNQTKDEVYLCKEFLKHYSHPISDWIHLWPSNPSNYREKMGRYTKLVQVLHKQLMEIVLESLGLNRSYLQTEIDEGMQMVAVNCYPIFPVPELASGMAPHTDHGLLTILLQSGPGLQLKDRNDNWVKVPFIEGALLVLLGDQMEVLSNGIYKSVIHKAKVDAERKRISIASIHSLAFEEKVRPAPTLVDKEHANSYKECSLKEFLGFIYSGGQLQGRFIDTLKNP